MKPESRLVTGIPVIVGTRTIIPVFQFSALIFEHGCLASVNPLALLIEENGTFFFAPVKEGVTWEQISPAFGIENGGAGKNG